MSATVFARGIAEQWRALLIASVSIGAMLALGLYIYQGIDLTIYDVLPDAMRALMGVPPHSDASLMAYNEMLGSIGALVLAGVAISVGAGAVARDEETGRLSLVLATPTSRLRFALGKAAAMVVTIVLGVTLLWGIAEAAPRILGVATGDARVGALMLHLGANTLFHGALAFAVATGLGRRALGAGIADTVMVGGWLAAGLLPMWRTGSADWVPWTWFNGSKPLANGVERGQLALLLGGALLLLALGTVGFCARELRMRMARPILLERLRAMPGVGRLLQPTGAGASLLGVRLAGHKVLVSYLAVLLALVMGLAMPALFQGIRSAMQSFAASFPQPMAELFGGGDIATLEGFLHLETFGMVAPLCMILAVTAAAGAGIAGEEQAGRMQVLLAQPLGRGRIYAVTAVTVAVYSTVIALALFLGTWAGARLARVDLSLANLAWACGLLLLLGVFFGFLALLLSAATGRPSLVSGGTAAIAVGSYFGYTLLAASGHPGWGRWSPFSAYLTGPPLAAGVDRWQPVWLSVGALACLGLGLAFWLRRDVRSGRG